MRAMLALEDGRVFPCRSFTGSGEASGEMVFNTSMFGYQEILSDPSYCGQMVTMTYPLIGNYGVTSEDMESASIHAEAIIVKEYQQIPSNFRSIEPLANFLCRHGKMGIEGLDTRALTLHIRQHGALRAHISTTDLDPATCVEKARAVPSMQGRNLSCAASSRSPYRWANGIRQSIDKSLNNPDTNVWQYQGERPSVAVFDFGIKHNILRCLEETGFEIIVLPADTDSATVRALNPDGIFLSNGPGDPEPATGAINCIRQLIGYRPIFGICMGHQLLSLALGGSTYKLKFGHRGGNQPVKDLRTGRIEITSQNHGFAVSHESLNPQEIEITHINLNDNTVEGFRHRHLPLLAVQFHPEASPGPHDAHHLFDEFRRMVESTSAKSVSAMEPVLAAASL